VTDDRLNGTASLEPLLFTGFHTAFTPVCQVNVGCPQLFRIALAAVVTISMLVIVQANHEAGLFSGTTFFRIESPELFIKD